MITKEPPVYDISHWKDVSDFNAIRPRPLLIITKATEDVSFVDGDFVRFMQGIKDAGIHRGCYHFHRKAFDGGRQAEHFIRVVENHIDDKTLLILDVEEGDEEASSLWEWFETVRRRFPNNRLMLYSSRRILDTIGMTFAERVYFRFIPTWIAGYPFFPDDFQTIPNFYVPDPTRFGTPWLWQYSEKGQIEGIIGDVDLNWIDPILIGELGEPPDPLPPTTGDNMYFKASTTINIRSSAGVTSTNDLGTFNLLANDIVEVEVDPVIIGSATWRKIRKIWRNDQPVTFAFSPSNEYWCAERVGTTTPLVPTNYLPPVTARHIVEVWVDNVMVFKQELS
jgi:GH25 family lysozyme M1 (1,4-beta-N-acetylmuramidase)